MVHRELPASLLILFPYAPLMLDSIVRVITATQFVVVALTAPPFMWVLSKRNSVNAVAGGSVLVVAIAVFFAGEGSFWLFAALAAGASSGSFRRRFHRAWVALPAAAGLLLLPTAAVPKRVDFAIVTVLVVTVASWAVSDFSSRFPALTWSLLTITATGLFFTVPRTANAGALLLAMVLSFVVAGPRHTPDGWTGLGATWVVLYVWIAMSDGSQRMGSVFGALAGFGIVMVEPASRILGKWNRRLLPRSPNSLPDLVIVLAHSLVVSLTSRVAGFQDRSEPAIFAAAVILALGWLAISRHANSSAAISRETSHPDHK